MPAPRPTEHDVLGRNAMATPRDMTWTVVVRGLRLTELTAPIGVGLGILSLSLFPTLSSPVKETPLDYKREGQSPRKGD
jgi:hypothetical protein